MGAIGQLTACLDIFDCCFVTIFTSQSCDLLKHPPRAALTMSLESFMSL